MPPFSVGSSTKGPHKGLACACDFEHLTSILDDLKKKKKNV